MDSEQYQFEVPIINLDEVHIINLDEVPLVNPEDQDCTIIVPKKLLTNSPHRNNYKEKTNCFHKESSRLLLKNTTPIVIDEDDKEDCTIIDDQTDSDNTIKKQRGCNSSKKSQRISFENKQSKEKNINEAPIDLDEDSDRENDCSIIESNEVSQRNCSKKNKTSKNINIDKFEEIHRKNKLLADLIERCLDMENSTGMLRIINRTLIPIYLDTSDHFKQSDCFQKFLTKVLGKLETEPNRKFLHLKELCEVMKAGMSIQKEAVKDVYKRKKVNLTTLKRNLNGKFSTTEMKSSDGTVPKKKVKHAIINVDDDDNDVIITSNDSGIEINDVICQNPEETPTIVKADENNMFSKTKEVVTNKSSNVIGHISEEDDVVLIENANSNSNKENVTTEQSENTSSNIPVTKSVSPKPINNMDAIEFYYDDDIANVNQTLNQLRVQQSHIETESHPEKQEDNVKKKIKTLENQIETYNLIVETLETKEVDWENTNENSSPYVRSEYYKRKIITIYKELCKLNGTEAVKRREVRLKVAEGRHEGPVRCLEKYINENIDKDGNPPFPDMLDVIQCVCQANEKYKLGWSKKQVEKEAQSLFIYYGRKVQKSRQMREWRHLLRYVKKEVVDPADEDPTLQARLEANAKLAVKNEMDLLDRYAQLEKTNPVSITGIAIAASENEYDSDTTVCNETIPKSVPSNVTEPNSVPSSVTLPNVTVHNNGNILSSATTLNSQDVFNSNVNDETSKNQTNNNFNLNNPLDTFVPKVTPTEAPYTLKYVVVDRNMKPIGVVANPPPYFKSLSIIELQKNNPIDDLRKETNSVNAVDSPGQQYMNNDQELAYIKQLKDNEVTLNLASNTTDDIHMQIIKDSFENTEAYIETDIKTNCNIEESVQYNEITTNSEVDISTNTIGDKSVIDNNEVTSSSEVCVKASEVINNTVSRMNDENTCELVNETKLLENGEICVYNAESTKSLDKSLRHVNGIRSDIENATTELLKDIEFTKNRNKTSKNVNKISAHVADKTGLVNDTRLSEIENKFCDIAGGTPTKNRDTSFGLINDKKLIVPKEKTSHLVNDKESTVAKDKTSHLVYDKESTVVKDKTSHLVYDKESTVVKDKTSHLVNDKVSTVVKDKTSHLVNDKDSTVAKEKTSHLVNDKESTVAKEKTCPVVNDTGSTNTEFNELLVKKEYHEDIPQMLEALGDNFTVTIIDIEDPFEVIEISDSSDSEDDL